MTIDGCHPAGPTRTVAAMDTRTLGYLGLGLLAAIVVATLIGVPPAIWIMAVLISLVIGLIVAVRQARQDGVDDAARMVAGAGPHPLPTSQAQAPAPTPRSSVESELVRTADATTGTPAVWLHRRGGRRVHRFETANGWVVQRVSTKDPDNPRKRIIGKPLTLATEFDAIIAADELARGQAPTTSFLEHANLATAEA
jgi:hypothetical protein